MNELLSLSGIVVALAIGAASPGPSFLLVARTAVSNGRKAGLATALGMGVGALIFAILALLGLNAVLAAVPWLYTALKLIGGIYLLYLAVKIWRSANAKLDDASTSDSIQVGNWHKQFAIGIGTQVSNPKTAIVYGGVFAAFLPQAPTIHFNLAVLLAVFFVEAGWYAIVATALSMDKSRRIYLQYKNWADRTAGTVMGLLGIKLATSATAQ